MYSAWLYGTYLKTVELRKYCLLKMLIQFCYHDNSVREFDVISEKF